MPLAASDEERRRITVRERNRGWCLAMGLSAGSTPDTATVHHRDEGVHLHDEGCLPFGHPHGKLAGVQIDGHHTVGVSVWYRLEEHRASQKHRAVCLDAERQTQYGQRRDTRRPPETGDCGSDVMRERHLFPT
jgi:hypothetical protein